MKTVLARDICESQCNVQLLYSEVKFSRKYGSIKSTSSLKINKDIIKHPICARRKIKKKVVEETVC